MLTDQWSTSSVFCPQLAISTPPALVDAMCEAAREGIEITTKPQPTGKCEVCGQTLKDTSRRWFVCSDNEVCRMTALVVALRFFGAVDSAR